MIMSQMMKHPMKGNKVKKTVALKKPITALGLLIKLRT
jgi:hypothetical protein